MYAFGSKTTRHSWLVLICCAFMCSMPVNLWAQESMTEEERAERFSALAVEAREYYDKGDFKQALALLKEANMLIADDRIMYNIGTTYEKLDDCSRALAYFEAALRVDNPTSGWPDKVKSKRDELSKECPDYNSSKVTGRISMTSYPAGATVYIDGKRVGSTPVETIMLPEGRHKFKVMKSGYEEVEETVVLSSQADLLLNYDLKKVTEPDIKIIDDPDPEPKPESKPLNIPAIAMIGAGAVGLGIGGYINWFRLCPDERCYFVKERQKYSPDSQEWQDLTDKRKTSVAIMATSTTLGVLLAAGGATWLVLDSKKNKEGEEQSLILAPVIHSEGAGVGMSWRF